MSTFMGTASLSGLVEDSVLDFLDFSFFGSSFEGEVSSKVISSKV